MIVNPGSVLIGKTIRQAGLTEENDINLLEIIRGSDSIPATDYAMKLMEDDRLVFGGVLGMVSEVQKIKGLIPVIDRLFEIETPRPDRCFVEAVVSNSNRFIGRSIVGTHFRHIYDAVVVAISRAGKQIKGSLDSIKLEEGDTLLLETNPQFLCSE